MLGLLFVILLVPETSDKTPETLHELFEEPWCCHRDGYERLGAGETPGSISNIQDHSGDREDITCCLQGAVNDDSSSSGPIQA